MMAFLPMFITTTNGKMDFDCKPEDIEKALGLPQAATAKTNLHDLLYSMSPWGTLDDRELIDYQDEDGGDFSPIWEGFNNRKDITKE